MKQFILLATIVALTTPAFAAKPLATCKAISKTSFTRIIKIMKKTDSGLEITAIDAHNLGGETETLKLKQELPSGNVYQVDGDDSEVTIFVDSKLKAVVASLLDGSDESDVNVMVCK